MTTTLLLLLYGLCAWGAGCNAPSWVLLFGRRWREARGGRRRDVYLWVRAGVMMLAIGTVGLAGDRLSAHLLGEMPLRIPSAVGLAAIGFMALGEIGFLWVSALRAAERGGAAWAWRVYWTGAAAWTGYVILAG